MPGLSLGGNCKVIRPISLEPLFKHFYHVEVPSPWTPPGRGPAASHGCPCLSGGPLGMPKRTNSLAKSVSLFLCLLWKHETIRILSPCDRFLFLFLFHFPCRDFPKPFGLKRTTLYATRTENKPCDSDLLSLNHISESSCLL